MRRPVPRLSPLPATPLGGPPPGERAAAPALGVDLGWLPFAVLVLAALPFLAQTLGVDRAPAAAIRPLLPIGVMAPDRVLALLSAVCLVGLAVGIHRHKSLAMRLATAALAGGLLLQLIVGPRPIAVVLGGAALAALVLERGRYDVRSADGWARIVAWTLTIAAVAVAVEAVASLRTPADLRLDARAATAAVLSWASFGDRWFPFHHGASPFTLLPSISARVIAAIGILGALRHAAPPEATGAERDRARATLERHGRGALLPFQRSECMRLFTRPGLDASLAFGAAGRNVIVLGDPVGSPADAGPVFEAFVAECRSRDLVPMFYQASGESRHRLLAAGFVCFKVGHEALVPLEGFSLAGSRRANLRHTVTRARRGGVSTRWYAGGVDGDGVPLDDGIREQLRDVDAQWRARHPGNLGFTISEFEPESAATGTIAVAFEQSGDVAAFATFQPTGGDAGWVLDLIRRRDGATPGAVECCLVEAADRLAAAGAATLSLGLAPLHGLDGSGPAEERLLARAGQVARPAYDVAGLAFFKAKFDPIWVPRYGAVPTRTAVPAFATALLSLHLGRSLVVSAMQMALTSLLARRPRGPALRGATARRG